MKRMAVIGALLAAIVVAQRGTAEVVEPADVAAAEAWVNAMVANVATAAPFSFVCDGRAIGEWMAACTAKCEATPSATDPRLRATLQFPKIGLEVRIEGEFYREFGAVEWVVYLKNTGATDTPILEDIQALDITLPTTEGDPTLHYAKGATCSIEDFRPMTRILNKGGRERIEPGGGRSSSDFMPFFNLECTPHSGVLLAIGWTGEWAAEFQRAAKGENVGVRCGLEHTHLKLLPGEEIRTPRVALLFREGGTWQRSQNVLRRFILAHHRPQPGGKPLEPVLLSSSWGGTAAADHLDAIRAVIERKLPADYYWIDAEWFGQGKWHQTAGDWRVKADLYPQSFKPLSDALHADGRKLLLWFEPERVCEGTPWYEERKAWLLEVPKEKRHYNWGTSQAEPDWPAWESARNQIRENDKLFNLGNPEARAFLTEFVLARIDEFGLDCFRHDANIAPLEFWRAADPPDRQGITEIRWVEGLYAFWDALLERHPGLIIDNCASGGRRIDLETLSRATPFWRTDFPAGATVKQCHTYGISSFAPLNATGAINPCRNSAYEFRSTWAGSLVYELFNAGEAANALATPGVYDFDKARTALQQYADLRTLFLGDYYPLTEYSQAEDAWMAWQFHREDLGQGLVQVFRRPASICEQAHLALQGLDPDAPYTITNVDSGEARTMSGKDLAAPGYALALNERPSAALLVYRKQ